VTTASSSDVVVNDETDSTLTVNAGATVVGSISLGNGVDDVTFNGGDFSGVTSVDGGSGADSLTFTNGVAAVQGSQVQNIETLVVGTGAHVSLSGTVDATTLSVEAGGLLGGSATVTADITVEAGGTVGAGNSPGILEVMGDINYASGSTLEVELRGLAVRSGYDRVDVTDDGTTAAIEGTATISVGALIEINFLAGFSGGLGNSFDVLVADNFDARLSTMSFDFSGAVLGAGLLWDYGFVDFWRRA
jgi:hypothetical protein